MVSTLKKLSSSRGLDGLVSRAANRFLPQENAEAGCVYVCSFVHCGCWKQTICNAQSIGCTDREGLCCFW